MYKYILNKNQQPTGEHEVHNESICTHLPSIENRVTIGNFSNCNDAINYTKNELPNLEIDGCYWCTNCHTR